MSKRAKKPVPKGLHSLTPELWFNGNCREAIDFYRRALDARVEGEIMIGPDGRVLHARIRIGDSPVFLSDTLGAPYQKNPDNYVTSGFFLYVKDSDELYSQAVREGCKMLMPIEDAFWGDRLGQVKDPYGYCWTIATSKWTLSKEEITRGQAEWFEKQEPGTKAA
jgi:PhnB protein